MFFFTDFTCQDIVLSFKSTDVYSYSHPAIIQRFAYCIFKALIQQNLQTWKCNITQLCTELGNCVKTRHSCINCPANTYPYDCLGVFDKSKERKRHVNVMCMHFDPHGQIDADVHMYVHTLTQMYTKGTEHRIKKRHPFPLRQQHFNRLQDDIQVTEA